MLNKEIDAVQETVTTDQPVTLEELIKRYMESSGKVYQVTATFSVEEDHEVTYTFLFHKPKTASYDRYIKTMAQSATKASKVFVRDNIVLEQKEELEQVMEEYPAIVITFADKLLKMLGLADNTTVKKL